MPRLPGWITTLVLVVLVLVIFLFNKAQSDQTLVYTLNKESVTLVTGAGLASPTITPSPTNTPTETPTPTPSPTVPTPTVTNTVPVTETPVPPTPTPGPSPTPTPIPQQFVYTQCPDNAGELACDLFIWEIPTGNAIQITAAVGDDKQAVFSPDGRSIAFISTRTDQAQLYIMDAFTYELSGPITNSDTDKTFPTWPFGETILFQRYDLSDNTVQGYVTTVNGGENRISPDNISWAKTPSISAYGMLALSVAVGDSNGDGAINDSDERHLLVTDTQGNNLELIASESEYYDMYPQWMPDGEWLLFSRHAKGETFNDNGPGDIYMVNVYTEELRRVTFTPEDEVVAIPSPDGESLLIVRENPDDTSASNLIYIASWNGFSLGATEFLVEGFIPAWRPVVQ